MTKVGKLFILFALAGIVASCGGPQGDKTQAGEAQEVSVKSGDVTLNVDL